MHPTIVWFRRDLRLQDNAALTAAVAEGGPIIPVFIYDDLVETFNRMNKTVIALPDWTSELILFHTKQTPYWIYPLQR